MVKQVLDIDSEFELMVTYQRTIESQSLLIEHSLKDQFSHGLYNVVKPYPSYDEYSQGHDFIEGELIEQSSDIVQLINLQDGRRFLFKDKTKKLQISSEL